MGDVMERQRMLEFVARFRPGVVGAELRLALGFGVAQEGEGEVEYPWYLRMSDLGYPPGWAMQRGDRGAFVLRSGVGRS